MSSEGDHRGNATRRIATTGLSRDIERSIERTEGEQLFSHSNLDKFGKRGSWVKFDPANFQTLCKLRHKVELKPRLVADLGLDLNPWTLSAQSLASLNYQLRKGNDDWATLRISRRHAVLARSIPVDLERIRVPLSCNVKVAAGLDWQRNPSFDFSLGDVRPKWLVVAAAVAAFAARQPLSGSRIIASTGITDPVKGVVMGEARATVRLGKEGNGLSVELGQLNALLRM